MPALRLYSYRYCSMRLEYVLFNFTVSFKTVLCRWQMNKGREWNIGGIILRGEKVLGENSVPQFVNQKSHMDYPGSRTASPPLKLHRLCYRAWVADCYI